VAWNLLNNGGSPVRGTRTVTVEVRDVVGNVGRASDRIYWYAPVSYFGSGCSGAAGVPAFDVVGAPGLGQNIQVSLTNTTAPLASLYLGVSRTRWGGIPLPVQLPASAGCWLRIAPDMPAYLGPPASFVVGIPTDPNLVGFPLYLQWLLFGDPSGKLVVSTRGAALDISGP
jgi:hypothetical protein